ncbi:glycosyltransferase family 4 protein [Microbacterium sp.]|uniref:glycosyltransferase family 4 protein n=1 Tax=Microbacterium sp. TaxID=51671 RepID=UPI00281188B9|nr:glycosyltransferase family 4 protein [Microbacterium sp.]
MKILVVSQFYDPEPVPIPGEIAREMQARGHSVRVLTGFPNYPSGRLAQGYRQRWRHREMDGDVEVRRVPLFLDHSQSALRRLVNYVTFALSATSARRFARGADVIYVYATPMTAAFSAWLWRITGGAPYVVHVQDLWPDSVVGSSMVSASRSSAIISAALSPWLRSVYRRAASVVGIAPRMVTTLVERGSPRDRTMLLYNWAEPAERTRSTLREPGGPVRIVYAGNVGEMQDLDTVVRAASAAADAGVELLIVGDGVARPGLRELANELGADNVVFRDPVPRSEMADVYEQSDFALVTLKDLPVFRGTIPSKFQAVLAAGLPVITTVQGDVREFVEANSVGLTADAEDVASLEVAMRRAAAMDPAARTLMSRRAGDVFEDSFSRESGLARLEEIFKTASRTNGAS